MILFNVEKTGSLIDDETCKVHCTSFNEKFGKGACSEHPNEPSMISVKVVNGLPIFTVNTCCCAKFREELTNKFRILNVNG